MEKGRERKEATARVSGGMFKVVSSGSEVDPNEVERCSAVLYWQNSLDGLPGGAVKGLTARDEIPGRLLVPLDPWASKG
uniref:Uncharacterized protein n=1 Tax=Chromera velia CCMP2878 TaxID=1169474 RepID=A0A0G4H0J7_9ALVE|eukprot:Cvel_5489.t1-p1 / transcript=Cvel_5489.t1 / gene=Cvel_5489 / organism=Chromera_velia_CCMP2878 / gene_product=hypothetical protein / transcript_product=hypothetical protein / location=Cvel_scaffold257:4508-5518(-) / protein_length=78 / sequence_SO=supercontig / SO=protein_coding / is_pseudo=false